MVEGGYWSIDLKDGRTANSELLDLYKGFLSYMECNHSGLFNRACRSVHQNSDEAMKVIEELRAQKNLDIAAFKVDKAAKSEGEARMKALWGNNLEEYFYEGYRRELYPDQIKVAIDLCTEPTMLSRVFNTFAANRPLSYKMTNPVKEGVKPVMVDYFWGGNSMNNVFERNILI